MRSPLPFRFLAIALMAIATALSSANLTPTVVGQIDPQTRPRTQELLPETTVMFVQIDNFRDMMEKFAASSGGQMWQDEAVAPLISGLWDEAKLAYGDVRDQVGVDLEDFTSLPAGEMTFAIIAPRRQNPEFMMILELNDENKALDRVLDRGRELLQQQAGEEITVEESDDGIKFESFNVEDRRVKFFRKDGLIVGSTSEEELDAFIDRWMGREVDKVRPLSQNRKFVTIMNRCVGSSEARPEARFFVDPIALAKSSTRGNFAAQAGLNFLPVVGLDGLLGLGGSMLLAEEEFESVVHGHVLLANPRAGVFEMISLRPTNYQPEPWLPADVVNYMTTSWDIDQMVTELTKMIETFNGEGVVDEWIETNINQEINLDLKEDILAHLSGRVTWIQWMEPPLRINSQVNVLAVELKDAAAFEKSLEAVVERINETAGDEDSEDRVEQTDYKGIRIWAQPMSRIEEQMERRRQRRAERGGNDIEADLDINIPQPAFALVGNYMLFSPQSRKALEHAIDTDQGDFEALMNDQKFQVMSKKMTRMLKTDMPCATMYQNPEESIKFLVELVNADSSKALLARGAEENKYLAGIKNRLEENPLPSYDTLQKYIRPSGGFAVTDDTGYHFLLFNLRADPEEESGAGDK